MYNNCLYLQKYVNMSCAYILYNLKRQYFGKLTIRVFNLNQFSRHRWLAISGFIESQHSELILLSFIQIVYTDFKVSQWPVSSLSPPSTHKLHQYL